MRFTRSTHNYLALASLSESSMRMLKVKWKICLTGNNNLVKPLFILTLKRRLQILQLTEIEAFWVKGFEFLFRNQMLVKTINFYMRGLKHILLSKDRKRVDFAFQLT